MLSACLASSGISSLIHRPLLPDWRNLNGLARSCAPARVPPRLFPLSVMSCGL